ncbi:diguanylate cyclase [Magnetospirillum sp. 64-120]|uniref:diguanylate cyclase n=1 Tax=Magnetospirillum sp. 64-120 TaxID=1895778 RepID=UPI00092AEB97|nr:diguanylate cyclase [Magnetospirillum sp. 64-120]OJX71873.1 MAG: hypothetical protein BGO92_04320 [Magnetospirillum sp. 64-120]
MPKTSFTLKVIVLAVAPLLCFAILLITLGTARIESLSQASARLTEQSLESMYRHYLNSRTGDGAAKVALRLEAIRNELNIVRGSAQRIIDEPPLAALGGELQTIPLLHNDFEYNQKGHWANHKDGPFGVSMSIWGYLLDPSGQLTPETRVFTDSMTPMKPLLHAVGQNGLKKGWLYVTGPKATPVMVMNPWAQMPAIFDEKYAGHNTANWWDFFFPGIIEGWQGWLTDPANRPPGPRDEVTLTPLYEDAGGTGLMVTFFAPLWNRDRTQNAGAAALDYNVSNLIELVEEETETGGFSFLMQSDGNVLGLKDHWGAILGLQKATGQKAEHGVTQSFFKLAESQHPTLREAFLAINDTNGFAVHRFQDDTGQTFLLALRRVTSFNLWTGKGAEIVKDSLYLGMVVPERQLVSLRDEVAGQIFRSGADARSSVVVMALILAALVGIVATWFALGQTRQLRLLIAGVGRIKQRHYDGCVEVVARDELGELTQAFNGMTLEIKASYEQLRQHAEHLEHQVAERTRELEQKNHELQRISVTDRLTGIYNRTKLDQVLASEHLRQERSGRPFGLILLDIDHFKRINDSFGHPVGDVVLVQTANILSTSVRATDTVGRWGGEEFLIVCPETDGPGLVALAENLRGHIAEHVFPTAGNQSASFGIAVHQPGESIEAIISRVDQALYRAKNQGRNRVLAAD